MKLIEIVEATAAGVGRHVIDLTEGLLSRGHEVHLLYSDLRADELFLRDLKRLGAQSGFHAHRIAMQREPSTSDIRACYALWQYLRRHGTFDLVHCHSTKAGLIGRMGLLADSVKRLYTPHGLYTMDSTRRPLARKIVGRLEASLAECCDSIIAVSPNEYEHALGLGIPTSKLCLIPNGVAAHPRLITKARRILRHDWGIQDDEVCIGFV
jgi:glycosyltransferase involved in cell wall biosynthesis